MARCTAGFGALVILTGAACAEDPGPAPAPPVPPAPSPPARNPWDPALGTATLVVRAVHEGKPVKMRPIKLDADPKCGEMHPEPVFDETVVEGPGGELAHVTVWIAAGLERFSFGPPDGPTVLQMRGCLFVPHVLSARAPCVLRIENLDPMGHHVHAVPKVNPEFTAIVCNRCPGGRYPVQEATLARPEVGLKIKDDVHGWMTAWLSLFDHPFHGVTGRDGTVALPEVPAGTYTVSVWHEYDRFTKPEPRTVTVEDGETLEIPFVFRDAGR